MARTNLFKSLVWGLFLFFLAQTAFVGRPGPGWLIRPWTGLFLLSVAMTWKSWDDARRNSREPWNAGVFFWGLAAVYLSSFRWHGSDDLPTSLLPFSLLRHGTLTLDPYAEWFAGYQHTAVVKVRGHLASFYPLPGAILSLPLYLPAVLMGAEPTDHVLHQLAKCAAALISAGAGTLYFFIYRRRTGPRQAFLWATAVGLGTGLFSFCSQGLWQFGPSCLFLGAALLFIDRAREKPREWALVGLFAGLCVDARTTNALFACAFMTLAFMKDGLRGWGRFMIGALPPMLTILLYWNTHLLGLPADIGYNASSMHFPPSIEALTGFWISPARGLLFFSPIVVIALAGLFRELGKGDRTTATCLLAPCLGSYILFSCFEVWHGAFSFGPRYLIEMIVVLLFFLPQGSALLDRTPLLRALRAGIFAVSILVNALGAYSRWRWEKIPESVWSPRRHPVVFLSGLF